jgi:hypothetical protein
MKLPEMSVIDTHLPSNTKIRGFTTEQMLAWGKACAESEREECAKVCETPIDEIQITDDCAETVYMDATECAAAIRARGNL